MVFLISFVSSNSSHWLAFGRQQLGTEDKVSCLHREIKAVLVIDTHLSPHKLFSGGLMFRHCRCSHSKLKIL